MVPPSQDTTKNNIVDLPDSIKKDLSLHGPKSFSAMTTTIHDCGNRLKRPPIHSLQKLPCVISSSIETTRLAAVSEVDKTFTRGAYSPGNNLSSTSSNVDRILLRSAQNGDEKKNLYSTIVSGHSTKHVSSSSSQPTPTLNSTTTNSSSTSIHATRATYADLVSRSLITPVSSTNSSATSSPLFKVLKKHSNEKKDEKLPWKAINQYTNPKIDTLSASDRTLLRSAHDSQMNSLSSADVTRVEERKSMMPGVQHGSQMNPFPDSQDVNGRTADLIHSTTTSTSKQQHQAQRQTPPLRYTFIIIDTEALEGKSVLSEVYMAVCQYQPYGHKFFICETYHACVKINKFLTTHQTKESHYIYKHITGLSFKTLNNYGISYQRCITEVHAIINRYPSALLLAREPALDQRLLQIPNVAEVLHLLRKPYCDSFYYRAQRDVEIARRCLSFQCNCHDPVVAGEPHCAVVDVWTIVFWLAKYGNFIHPEYLNIMPEMLYLGDNNNTSSNSLLANTQLCDKNLNNGDFYDENDGFYDSNDEINVYDREHLPSSSSSPIT